MIILTIEISEGLKEIELHYDKLEPVVVKLLDGRSCFIDKHGKSFANEIPATIIVSQPQLEDLQWQPNKDVIRELKRQASENLHRKKKRREEIVPYAIAAEVINGKFPSLGANDTKKLIDRIRKFLQRIIDDRRSHSTNFPIVST